MKAEEVKDEEEWVEIDPKAMEPFRYGIKTKAKDLEMQEILQQQTSLLSKMEIQTEKKVIGAANAESENQPPTGVVPSSKIGNIQGDQDDSVQQATFETSEEPEQRRSFY